MYLVMYFAMYFTMHFDMFFAVYRYLQSSLSPTAPELLVLEADLASMPLLPAPHGWAQKLPKTSVAEHCSGEPPE